MTNFLTTVTVNAAWFEIAGLFWLFIPALLFNATVPKGSMPKKKRIKKGMLYTFLLEIPGLAFCIYSLIYGQEAMRLPMIFGLFMYIILFLAKGEKIRQSSGMF